jgi:hypothetical protein
VRDLYDHLINSYDLYFYDYLIHMSSNFFEESVCRSDSKFMNHLVLIECLISHEKCATLITPISACYYLERRNTQERVTLELNFH